jgi:hypothetical protein
VSADIKGINVKNKENEKENEQLDFYHEKGQEMLLKLSVTWTKRRSDERPRP